MMASQSGEGRKLPWRPILWAGAYSLLLVPRFAGWPWTLSDYVFAGTIFAVVGATFELAARKSADKWYRRGVAIALAATFLLVWINGAVGIIGREDNPANLMFFLVIAIAVVCAVATRLRASGMALAMGIAALAELAVGAIVLVMRLGASEPPGLTGVLAVIFAFTIMFLLSAWSFLKAARSP
jgi:hypothetical protein